MVLSREAAILFQLYQYMHMAFTGPARVPHAAEARSCFSSMCCLFMSSRRGPHLQAARQTAIAWQGCNVKEDIAIRGVAMPMLNDPLNVLNHVLHQPVQMHITIDGIQSTGRCCMESRRSCAAKVSAPSHAAWLWVPDREASSSELPCPHDTHL